MKPKPAYSQDDVNGVAVLVSAIVGHPVDCATADAEYMGVANAVEAYQIMPATEVERKSPVKEFWWKSAYSQTPQFYDSPIAAGLHYAKHFLAFLRSQPATSSADPSATN